MLVMYNKKPSSKSSGSIIAKSLHDNLGAVLNDVYGILCNNPQSFFSFMMDAKKAPGSIRDSIFVECFIEFYEKAYDIGTNRNAFIANNLRAFSVALAEATPNLEADYAGNPEKLHEYAKRVVKAIDDCGTIQKASYIGYLSRALMNDYPSDIKMDTNMYFKLIRCIRNLTEEDLEFLNANIREGLITDDMDYIDDFISLGLMKGVSGGYEYTERAYYLKKYALDYEHHNDIPQLTHKRVMPAFPDRIDEDYIDNLFKDNN